MTVGGMGLASLVRMLDRQPHPGSTLLPVMSEPDPNRFGELVRRRRNTLGMTMRDVAEGGGPSTPTMNRLEAGRIRRPDRDTFVKLDHVLQWVSGSAARAFNGGVPESTERSTRVPTASGERPIIATDAGVLISTQVLSEYVTLVDRLGKAVSRPDLQKMDADGLRATIRTLEGDVTQLQVMLNRVLRAWITVQVEQWKMQGELQQRELVINMMIGDQLDREPDQSETPQDDLEDINYLRWLLNRRQDAAAEDVARWRQRWERSHIE